MRKSFRNRGRAFSLILVGVVLGAALITPAGAHVGGTVGHLWSKHLLPLAKGAFYTKSQSDGKYLGKTAKAADADKLDGQNSTDFLGATAKAADSDKLDGKDSADFVASSKMLRGVAFPDGGASGNLLDLGSNAVISLGCHNHYNGITNVSRVKVASGGWVVATNDGGTIRGFASYSADPANDDPLFVDIGDAGWVHLNINFGQYVIDVSNNYGIGAADSCSASATGFKFI
jgi:hypothetical protein